MGLRETINNNSRMFVGILAVVIIGALAFLMLNLQSNSNTPPSASTKAFYTIDDGKTWFSDDAGKLPFTKDGQPAFQAYVFKGADGKEFVGYIERLNPNLEKLLAGKQGPERESVLASGGSKQVKKPGAVNWLNPDTQSGHEIVVGPVVSSNGAAKPVEP